MPKWEPDDIVAAVLVVTVAAVLVVVLVDLTLAAQLSTADRAASLAAIGAIGLALAAGIGRWLDHRGRGRGRGRHDDA